MRIKTHKSKSMHNKTDKTRNVAKPKNHMPKMWKNPKVNDEKMTKMDKTEKEIISQDLKTYPAGRSKYLQIATYQVVEPKTHKKRNPKRYCIFRVPANPEHFEIVTYKPRLNSLTIYPNRKRLTHEETTNLVASLLTYYLYTYRGQNTIKFPTSFPRVPLPDKRGRINLGGWRLVLPLPLRKEYVVQRERFLKWLNKNKK